MKICAVCDAEVSELEAIAVDVDEGEEPIFVCGEACLGALHEDPELHGFDELVAEEL